LHVFYIFKSILLKLLNAQSARIHEPCELGPMLEKYGSLRQKSSQVTAAKELKVDEIELHEINNKTMISIFFLAKCYIIICILSASDPGAYLRTALNMQETKIPIIPGIKASSLITKYGTIASAFLICPSRIGQHPEYVAKTRYEIIMTF